MPSVWLVSDTHFGHAGVCRFTRSDGVTKLRPWDNPDEMDEAMVAAWNDRVRPTDKVYHLGDVVINRKASEYSEHGSTGIKFLSVVTTIFSVMTNIGSTFVNYVHTM
jgi:calcineurin-like phosphoesterase family protein